MYQNKECFSILRFVVAALIRARERKLGVVSNPDLQPNRFIMELRPSSKLNYFLAMTGNVD